MTNNGPVPVKVIAEPGVPQTKMGAIVWAVERLGVPAFMLILLSQLFLRPLLDELIETNRANRDINKQTAVSEALQGAEMKGQTGILVELRSLQDATRQAVIASDLHKMEGTNAMLNEQKRTHEAITEGTKENREARAANMKLLLESIEENRKLITRPALEGR